MPAVLTATLRSRGAVPLAGVTVSHDASSEAVKDRVPPPVLVTLTVLAAGFAPPTVPPNVSDAGSVASTGGGGGPAGVPNTYAEAGPSVHRPPVRHVSGSATSASSQLV